MEGATRWAKLSAGCCSSLVNTMTLQVMMSVPLGGNRQVVATTASTDLIANKGAQCAHMSIFTNYQVKRCGEPILPQGWR